MATVTRQLVTAGIWMLVIGVGYTQCAGMFEPRVRTPAEAAVEKQFDSLYRCQNEMKSRMADTEGFDVAPYGEWRTEPEDGPDQYTYQFSAKAKNAFGALIWVEMTCKVVFDGKRWSVTDLKQN